MKIADLNKEVKMFQSENDDLKEKLNHADEWLKPVYKNMSLTARTEFKTVISMARSSFSLGTLSRIRNNTGINFSKPQTAPNGEESPLKKEVYTFAMENSCEVPDMRAAKKGKRYFYSYKYVLWIQFKSSQASDISYSHFCRYWPANIIKPKIEDLGTCK